MSDERVKKRFSVILTGPFLEALDLLIEEGIYKDHQSGIRDALRSLFRFHGIEPFRSELVEEAEKVQE